MSTAQRPPVKKRLFRGQPTTGIVIEQGNEPSRTWRQEIAFWIRSAVGLGYALSLVAHLTILLVLALLLMPHIVGDQGFTIDAAVADKSDGETEEILDTEFELPEIEPAAPLPNVELPMETTSALNENEIAADISKRMQAAIGDGFGDDDVAISLGEPGKNAVVKGSFTAWTVPDDPKPGQDYRIFIRIKTPGHLKDDYPLNDLTGLVLGTDGYRQVVPGPRSPKSLRIKQGYAQFHVTVPGAYRLVRDKIRVHSRLLEEEQLLEIVF